MSLLKAVAFAQVISLFHLQGIQFSLNHSQHVWIIALDGSWLCTKGIVGLFAAASRARRAVISANGVQSLAAITFVVRSAVWSKLIARIAERILVLFSTKGNISTYIQVQRNRPS